MSEEEIEEIVINDLHKLSNLFKNIVEVMEQISKNLFNWASNLDEIPQAYKPIDQVMTDADDLVEIRHTLRQIINVKGD